MLSACGEACDPDPRRALRKALLEFCSARVRKTYGHGPLDEALSVAPPGYVDDFVRTALPSLELEESRALRAMMDWTTMDARDLKRDLDGSVFSVVSRKSFMDLPGAAAPEGGPSDTRTRGRVARERLEAAGFDVLYVDCSPRDGAFGVVKVIVPGLEVETMSYYRIGERNTRKLLERDSPLVRVRRAGRDAPAHPALARSHRPPGAPDRRPPAAVRHRRGGPHRRAALSALPRTRSPSCGVQAEAARRCRAPGDRLMALRFAYNTNGTASHRLDDALMLMAETGYAGVALTLDHNHFDPFAKEWEADAKRLAQRLRGLGFGSVIETGARYLLDPRQKHEPTFVTADPPGGPAASPSCTAPSTSAAFWDPRPSRSGPACPSRASTADEAWDWLHAGLEQVVAYAGRRGVVAALEPEPGMLVETVDDYRRLAADIPGLKLALDTGHLLVTGEREPAAAIAEFKDQLGTVTIEDMRRGDHVHLPFGEGDMDVPAVLDALDASGFGGLVCVELSRDSHRADLMIPEAFSFLSLCRQNVRAAPKPAAPASRVDVLA